MHIQDGIISPPVCLAAAAISAASLAVGLRRLRREENDRLVPLTGMVAALIFAGQMVNFPLFGTMVSGHLQGGVLAASLLGPWAGCLALTLVLTVQCLMFADGGLLSLGVNILHMAVIGAIGGHCLQTVIARMFRQSPVGLVVGGVVASWITVVASAALFCLEFACSHGTTDYDLSRIATLMISLHSLIGIGEALITGSVLTFLVRHRPDLMLGRLSAASSPMITLSSGTGIRSAGFAGLMTALAISAFLAPLASSHPDGFESVAARTGVDSLEEEHSFSLFPGYETTLGRALPRAGEDWQVLAIAISGIGGCLVVFLIAFLLGRSVLQPLQSGSVGSPGPEN